MARPYIRMRKSLQSNPKVEYIAEAMRKADGRRHSRDRYKALALGYLVQFWWIADEFADEHGVIEGLTLDQLKQQTSDAFVSAVHHVGWLLWSKPPADHQQTTSKPPADHQQITSSLPAHHQQALRG